MKKYLKNIIVIFFVLFSFYYTDKVIEISKYNDTILVSINDYAKKKIMNVEKEILMNLV